MNLSTSVLAKHQLSITWRQLCGAGSLLKQQCFKHDNNRSEQPGTTGRTQEIQSSTLLARAHLQLKSVVLAQFFRLVLILFALGTCLFRSLSPERFVKMLTISKEEVKRWRQGPVSGMLKPQLPLICYLGESNLHSWTAIEQKLHW